MTERSSVLERYSSGRADPNPRGGQALHASRRVGSAAKGRLAMTIGLAVALTVGVLLGQSHILPSPFGTPEGQTAASIPDESAESMGTASSALILPVPKKKKPVEDNWLAERTRDERIAALPELLDLTPRRKPVAAHHKHAAVASSEARDAGSLADDPKAALPRPKPAEIRAAIDATAASLRGTQLASGEQTWRKHAVAVAGIADRPMIAIVIDDLGLHRPNAKRTIALPGPLTLAFMSYAPRVSELTEAARARGHELMVHVPMEPRDLRNDPGKNPLLTSVSREENQRRLKWALSRFDGYVGINNHMGSAFTASAQGMADVMAELKARGLLFLDSKTAGNSVGTDMAREMNVPYAARNVFIDNDYKSPAAIRRQLAKLESAAKRQGYAVGIGHPHSTTIKVLADWLPELRARGFALVPVSAIVKHRIEVAAAGQPAG